MGLVDMLQSPELSNPIESPEAKRFVSAAEARRLRAAKKTPNPSRKPLGNLSNGKVNLEVPKLEEKTSAQEGDAVAGLWSHSSTASREGPDVDIDDSVVLEQLAELRSKASRLERGFLSFECVGDAAVEDRLRAMRKAALTGSGRGDDVAQLWAHWEARDDQIASASMWAAWEADVAERQARRAPSVALATYAYAIILAVIACAVVQLVARPTEPVAPPVERKHALQVVRVGLAGVIRLLKRVALAWAANWHPPVPM